MKEFEIKVQEKYNGMRLDKYIAEMKNNLSRSQIQSLIDRNQVEVNGKVEKKSYSINTGDNIIIYKKEPKMLDLPKKEMDLDIIFEDEDIIIINKPVGLIVHPVKGNRSDTLVNALLAHTDKLGNINGTLRPGIVHRLDKNTSGAILVAKNQSSLNNLQKQFKERKTKKIYRTILEGTLPYNSGTIDAPIGRNPKNRTKMAVVKENSKKAVTEFNVIKRYNNFTYLEANLKTGRTHQIRVHFAHLGFPIIGDKKYGSETDIFDLEHQLLHAYQLGFYHPKTNQWVEYNAELPTSFQKILAKIKDL